MTQSKRRRQGREDYDGGDWRDACPYQNNEKRHDYYVGWNEEACKITSQNLAKEDEQDEFDSISCSCPSRSNGECTILKNLECSKENCVPRYWKDK